MSNTRDHIEFDALNDFVDGRLDRQAASDVAAHLASCPTCSAQHDELASLLSSAELLPKSVLPPDDMWADLRTALDSRKDVVLPSAGENAHHPPAIATFSTLAEVRRLPGRGCGDSDCAVVRDHCAGAEAGSRYGES
jgi:anti-sigma factor RsiW